ncbi:MAG: hypothetical protein WEC80_02545, partial [Patescibacteria group bacterium]
QVGNDIISIVMCNLFIFLSFITFYGSVFFIAAIYLWLLFKRQFRFLFMLLPGLVLAGILIYPLFIQQLINSKIALTEVKNWNLVLGQSNIKNLLLIPIKFSIGRISFDPQIVYYSIAGLWTAFVFYFVIKGWKNTLFYLIGITITLAFLASFFIPMLQYFRYLYLIPLICLLLATTVKNTKIKWFILVGFTVFSFTYLLNPAHHREDWKSLVKNLNSNIVYMIPSSSDPVKYYNKNIEVRSLNQIGQDELNNEIIVIPYTAEIHGVNYDEVLKSKSYELSSEKSYRELKIEIWNKK